MTLIVHGRAGTHFALEHHNVKFAYSAQGQTQALEATHATNGVEIKINDNHLLIPIVAEQPPRLTFIYNGRIITAFAARQGKQRWIHLNGSTYLLEQGAIRAARAAGQEQGVGSGLVTAPMPGQVRRVLVNQGDWVEEGQPLLLLEAMKMEIRVRAPRAGQVVSLHAAQGQSVEREQILATIKGSKQ